MSEEISRDCWLTNEEMRAMVAGMFKHAGQLTDWANAIGVNRGVVSRAANGTGQVPAVVARALGYRPIIAFVPIEDEP